MDAQTYTNRYFNEKHLAMETIDIVKDLVNLNWECMSIKEYVESIHNRTESVQCEEFPITHAFYVQIIYCFMFAALFLIAISGNLTVAWIILKHERMRTKTNFFLLNLAISDLSITILNTGFSSVYNLYYNWFFPLWYCKFNNLMAVMPITSSVFTMMVMSVDRYFAIVHPLKRRPSKNATISIIIVIWILAFLCGLPAFLGTKIEYHYFLNTHTKQIFTDTLCLADNFPDGDSKTSTWFCIYNHWLVTIQYVFPLVIISFTYGRVAYVLRQNNCIGDTRHLESVKAKRRASNM